MDNEEIYYACYYGSGQYPTMKKTVSAIVDHIMETDKTGQFGTMTYIDGWSFTDHAVTWDEINAILDPVPDATPYFSVEEDENL